MAYWTVMRLLAQGSSLHKLFGQTINNSGQEQVSDAVGCRGVLFFYCFDLVVMGRM